MKMLEEVPLAPKTTFQIGGPARYFCSAVDIEDVREAVRFARSKASPVFIMGGGSNLLVSDDGFPGVVIQIANSSIAMSGCAVTVGAGTNLWQLIKEVGSSGLSGIEKLAGIPGTVGGAVRGNAGAFGCEIKDVVQQVEAFNIDTGESRVFTLPECEFAYRTSFFKTRPEWVIWRIYLVLAPGNTTEINRTARETVAERNKRHIQNVRAAGSFFMNPVVSKAICKQFMEEKGQECRGGRVPAGWLIERADCKGLLKGGARASRQHPNYIVNERNARSASVCELANIIRAAVRKKTGVVLQPEAYLLNCELSKMV